MSFEEVVSVFFASESAFEQFVFVYIISVFPPIIVGGWYAFLYFICHLVRRFIYPGKQQPSDQEVKS